MAVHPPLSEHPASATPKQRLFALLATGRAHHLPTIWTNVLVAFSLSFPWSQAHPALQPAHLDALLLGCLLATCFFLGGSFLSDACDAREDATKHPDRPIPSGVLSPTRVAFAGYALLATAWFGSCVFQSLLWATQAPAEVVPAVRSVRPPDLPNAFYGLSYDRVILSTFLAVCILLYTRFHGRIGTCGPVLMALCRGLLVLWAGALANPWFARGDDEAVALVGRLLPYALCVLTYTLVLMMVAHHHRNPAVKGPSPLLQILHLIPPLAVAGYFAIRAAPHASPVALGLAAVFFLTWSIRSFSRLSRSISAFVSRSLPGFCLLDALIAALIGWQEASLCLVLFLAVSLIQRFLSAP